jgi:uncharacterized protein (DUF983 family)
VIVIANLDRDLFSITITITANDHDYDGGPHKVSMTRLLAIIQQRCPVCMQGKIFRRLLWMHPTCPVCQTRYEREDGYFMMSVFLGYVLNLLILVPVVLVMLLNDVPLGWYAVGLALFLLFVYPLVFRYARVIWMHLDQMMDPRGREA